jgi:hypothetical protein
MKFDEPAAARAAFQRAHELGHEGAAKILELLEQQGSMPPPSEPAAPEMPAPPLVSLNDRGGAAADGLPTDGVYQCPEGTYSSFLRFAGDGQVFTVSSTGSPRDVASWLNGSSPAASRGHYAIAGDFVEFCAASSEGTVDYNGQLLPNGDLLLDSYSHINGHRATGKRFSFVPV